MSLSNNTSNIIALLIMALVSIFCFANVWILVLSNSETNIFASLYNGFFLSLNEVYGTKRYLTNLFLLPLIYAFFILALLLVYFAAPSRGRLKRVLFSVFGFGIILSIISISYADGFSFVLIATIIMFFAVISIRRIEK
jgi:hypothetical protein